MILVIIPQTVQNLLLRDLEDTLKSAAAKEVAAQKHRIFWLL